ncbi:MAG: hypothetical protein WAQ98_09045, partial [Blastocatellia bacterium]
MSEREAQTLLKFILSQYQNRVMLQSYTAKTLVDCCAILSEIVPELNLSPLIILGTSNCADRKQLLN